MPDPTLPPAQLAKQALRRLAVAKLEPTPENYARAYAIESGQESSPAAETGLPERAQPALQRLLQLGVTDLAERQELQREWRLGQFDEALKRVDRILSTDGPAAQGEALAQTIDKLVRGLERGGRQWTVARKKDGLQRVLSTNRSEGGRLIRRLRQLVSSWDSDAAGETVDALQPQPDDEGGGSPSQFFSEEETQATAPEAASTPPLERLSLNLPADRWSDIGASLHQTVHTALQPSGEPAAQVQRAQDLLSELAREQREAQAAGATPERAEAIARLCEQARRMLEHRQHLAVQLSSLCRELSASLVELSEDESWAQGQAQAMNQALDQGLSTLAVRAVSERLSKTRERQHALQAERRAARDALKGLMQTLLTDLGALGEHTDRFHQHLGRYNEVIEKADSLESLTGAVREMLQESRTVQGLVQQTQTRLSSEHQRATALADRVGELERELLRLSEEVQTDQLTQVANRRGLQAAFATEQAKLEREEQPLAIALLDIDNFKKLNDSLGHAAGDEALKGLAARAQSIVRPGDRVARFGGEEFVLLLPNTPLDEAQQVLGRLQRSLSASLFMHEGKDVFVTFSAGATLYRKGEQLEDALQRADEALYEAKRTGKNRTCLA